EIGMKFLSGVVGGLVLAGFASATAASGSYSGTVSGSFANAVLAGNFLFPDGSTLFFDNTSSAVYSFPADNGLRWGDFPTSEDVLPYSEVYFYGHDFTNIVPGETFDLGTFYFYNGTSVAQTLIFGADLTLDFGDGI